MNNDIAKDQLVYTLKEAAVLLAVSVDTLEREIGDKRLPMIKIRGRRMVAKADLEAYVKRLRSEGGRR